MYVDGVAPNRTYYYGELANKLSDTEKYMLS